MGDWLADLRARDPARARRYEQAEKRRQAADRRARALRHVVADDAAAMLHCPMRAESVRGLTKAEVRQVRVCFLCGEPQPKLRQFWCSDACVIEWSSNHEWTPASFAALKRAERQCERCRRSEVVVYACRVDGEPWPCRASREYDEAWRRYRDGGPIPRVLGHGHTERVDPVASVTLEVNHIDPRAGRGYHQGCHHHLSALEVLCHPDHVAETNRQMRERREAARAAVSEARNA